MIGRLKQYIFPVLVLTLLVGLIEGFRSFFIANIIEPIAVVCWLIWRIISSVDQKVYWIILIVVCAFLVIRFIPTVKGSSIYSPYNYEHLPDQRVDYWKSLITAAAYGKYNEETLRNSLRELLLSSVSRIEGKAPMDLEEAIGSKKNELPVEVKDFLFPPKEAGRHFLVLRWFRKRARRFSQRDITSVERILEWMEREMEISHDQ